MLRAKRVMLLRLMPLALLALFIPPQEAFAGLDGSGFHKSYNYQISLSGTNSIKLKFPCGGDHHEFSSNHKSVLNFTLQGQSSQQLMELHSKNGTKNDPKQEGKFMYFWFNFNWDCAYNHTLQLTSGSQNAVTFSKDGGVDVAKAPNDFIFWIEMEFRVPQSWCGKRVEFEWDVWSTDNKGAKIPTDLVTLDIPEAPEGMDPELTQTVIMPNDIGKIGYMWYISARDVVSVFAQWKTSENASGETMQSLGNDMNGTVLLDATEPHYDFHIVANYTDTYGYTITNRSTEKVNVPMLHAPINLKAEITSASTSPATPAHNGMSGVMVTWDTNHPGYPDISETDVFEVQRSLTGREADYQTITSEMYDDSKTHYEFFDENYLKDVQTESQLQTTKYRVRRSSTALWGWEDNPTVATTMLAPPLVALYVPTGSTASWADEAAHTMHVAWDYLPSISSATPQRHYAEYVGKGTEGEPYAIASTDDWNQLADWIANNNAEYADKYYRLDADIEVWRMIGDDNHRFKGHFDGNGHTISLAIQADGKESVAPFRWVENASIKNLRIAGTVDAKAQQFASSLIGYSYGHSNIKNCWSSATIKGNCYERGDRDATHGGFLAILKKDVVTFDNCLFDGSIIDQTAINCGGFVGWVSEGNNRAVFNNCLMAGTMTLYEYFTSSSKYSSVFARCPSNMQPTYLKFSKCYHKPGHGILFDEGLYGITDASAMDDATLLAALGNGWEIAGEVAPVLATSWQQPLYYLLPGSGTAEDPYLIECNEDWDNFAEMLTSENEQYGDKHYRLANNITVRTMVGGPDKATAFRGTFNGDGYTISLCIQSDGNDYVAPFRHVERGTISNLRIRGTVDAGQQKYASTLIGLKGSDNVTIANCWSSATINGDRSALADKEACHGGFVGYGDGDWLGIANCRFDGTIIDPSATRCSGFVGAKVGRLHLELENNLMAGSMRLATLEGSENFSPDNSGTIKSYYVNPIGSSEQGIAVGTMTADELAAALGSAWTVWKGQVAPVALASEPKGNVVYAWDERATMTLQLKKYSRDGRLVETTDYPVSAEEMAAKSKDITLNRSCVNTEVELMVDKGTSPLIAMSSDSACYAVQVPDHRFYFQVSGQVSKTVMAETRQSSVVLTWDMDGDAVDFFQVMRKEKNQPDTAYEVVADSLVTMAWEDTTVSPLYTYTYKVRSAVDCEGLSFNTSDEVEGACKHTGKVEGRIQFPDGTGLAGITFNISSDDGSVSVEAVTDENGHFEADELSYLGQNSVTYNVTPVSSSQLSLQVDTYAVTFNSRSNYTELKAFVVTSGRRFSGFVMYDGTSIPVKGAGFLLNGHQVMRGGKPLETNFEGKFSFYVISGTNTIQAVMDGHRFIDNGYFKSNQGYDFQGDVENIYFYDDTKVKLIGRIVGGDTQGKLPLDNNLSRNNLGTGVKMVLSLEGDNTSWLVYDNQNPEKSTNDYTIAHEKDASGGDHFTRVHTTRKRMEVWTDSITGEYRLELPPVRWKVQQIYSDGYATLFQEGMVNEVIDLSDCLQLKSDTVAGRFTTLDGGYLDNPVVSYNAQYSRIYHNPVELSYQQQNYDSFSYLGDKFYKYKQVDGSSLKIPLAEPAANGGVKYTFGYPVYSLYMQYPTRLSAVERYFWNNDANSGIVDEVKVGGGKVIVQNDMKMTSSRQEVMLDENGEGTFVIMADELPYLLKGKDALRTVTMTLTQDGTTYEAKPIQAYVLNIFRDGSAKDIISIDKPTALDILRDPPGANSSATLSRGTTLSTTYSMDMSLRVGTTFGLEVGKKLDNYIGVVIAPPAGTGSEFGTINKTSNTTIFDFDITYRTKASVDFSYTAKLTQDISTSSDPGMVGAPADLYIGTVNNMSVTPASTIRAIPDSVFQQMAGKLGGTYSIAGMRMYGSMVEIAQGRADDGSLYHLVRDESLVAGNTVKSTFIYSQQHILGTVLPQLVEQSRSLMFIGSAEDAQAKADATGQLVYRSLLPADDIAFAVANKKDGQAVFNAYQPGKADEPGMNYVIHVPQGLNIEGLRDSIAGNWNIIQNWVEMIATNEMQKQYAMDMAANYSLDGGGTVSYGEEFTSRLFTASHSQNPLMIGTSSLDSGTTAVLDLLGGLAVPAMQAISKIISSLGKSAQSENKLNKSGTEVSFTGTTVKFNFEPVFDFDLTDWGKEEMAFSRKENFTIKMNPMSHIDVDVLRVQPVVAIAMAMMQANGGGGGSPSMQDIDYTDMSSSMVFFGITDMAKDILGKTNDTSSLLYASSFAYRTRGGATAQPWEDERRALFFNTGTVLDARTKKIENPKIKLDKQSISGVAPGEAARFTVFMTNESEQPDAVTEGTQYFLLYLKDGTNPNGAKVFCDGIPMNGGGVIVRLLPGEIVQKVVEVTAGTEFDYEGLTLGLKPQAGYQASMADEVAFDVHFLHTAGQVDIDSPADHWVMNTEAEYDNERGYFIPVVIGGFDKHQKNFDHIEFQYKETARGDDCWTNLCSYYADSTLMAKASGVKEMIPENGNITAHFYGEGVTMEKAYDLRAVLYCRNGNDFLTTASKVMSGVKDTRRPQLFGTPAPTNGILAAGENILFNFSEDIEYNYLSAITNFEVKGEVNNDAVTNDVALLFGGSGGAQTEAERNFADKDITIDMMIRPDAAGQEMPLFAHGSDGKRLQLWVTADNRLKAKVDDREYLSVKPFKTGEFTQVAMVLQQPPTDGGSGRIAFYNGGESLGSFDMDEAYTGTGIIVFGATNEANPRSRSYYSGRMMEARLWYRALTGAQIGTLYGYRRLTGYEKGLMDYWPMDDAQGSHVVDKAQGATLQVGHGVAWAKPGGMSLQLNAADKGLALHPMAINRTAEQDYTLMFWFRNDGNGRGGTLLGNGSGHSDDAGAQNQFFIGFEGDELKYRSNGTEVLVPGHWDDGDWHHYAMTVNRAMNTLNIYVDQALRASIEPETLGGISGGHPMLGSCVYDREEDGMVKTFDAANYLEGRLDEICLFDQALPLTLIKRFGTRSPQGDEAGLVAYLGFQHQERSKDNDIVTQPYVYSKKIYRDEQGEVVYEKDPLTQQPTTTPQRDYLFVDEPEAILRHIDQDMGAPVLPEQELHNLNFSFVGRDHSILLNINSADEKVNKRNIYVTMREIPDKNGNSMASAATACFFVDRNPLRWKQKTVQMEQDYGEATTFQVAIQNNSQVSHTYTIENYPRWLTVSPRTNTIGATEEQWITFTVNKDLNVGKFDEIIYLTDENGLAEPIVVSLKVNGNEPAWTSGIDRALRQHSMNITARVMLNNEVDVETDDIVGVFDNAGVCHGVANISFNDDSGESFAFITVYDSLTTERPLNFRLWNHSIGREQTLMARDDNNTRNVTITFAPSKVVGSPTKPLLLTGGEEYVQNIALYKGWNWVSFNLRSQELDNFNTLLDRLPLHEGDIMTDNSSGAVLVYTNGHWMTSGGNQDTRINYKHAYFFKVQEDVNIQLSGTLIKEKADRTINVGHEWNSIGYTPMLNLTVQTALTDYNNKAKDGDVIKSHDEYAIFTEVNGVGQWKGSLKYMKPSEGYMLYRTDATEAAFTYPFYEPTSTFLDEVTSVPRQQAAARANMSLTAQATGIDILPGDRLMAFTGSEPRGEISADDEGIFYLSVAGDKDAPIWFALEREGDIIASTSEMVMFKPNAVIGKPQQPATIAFTTMMPTSEGWYSTSGVKLANKPKQAGVYIHNGKKVVIH